MAGGITCSGVELVALVGLLDGKAVIGIEDPLRGLSRTETDKALVKAREALERRQYLRMASDGFIELDKRVAELVQVVAKPDRSYYAYVIRGAEPLSPIESGTRRVFHARGNLGAEVIDAAEATVRRLRGRDAIASTVVEFWHITNQPPAGAERATLSQQALHDATRLALEQGSEATLTALRDAGLLPRAAATLADTLVSPIANGALIAFSLSNQRQTATIGFLEGQNGLWRMRTTAGQVTLEATTAPALARLVRD
ncbi:MAG TPA: hypothetical protein VFG86_16300, partial [Chloroflexota bacterium]|nr:hypothetical protein [Chloroflexota bacterium]